MKKPSQGLLAPGPAARGHRDLPDGLGPVAPQRLPDGLHAHLEAGEAQVLEESAVVGVLAGRGHEEVVHCNESVPSVTSPAFPGPAWGACPCGEGAWGLRIPAQPSKGPACCPRAWWGLPGLRAHGPGDRTPLCGHRPSGAGCPPEPGAGPDAQAPLHPHVGPRCTSQHLHVPRGETEDLCTRAPLPRSHRPLSDLSQNVGSRLQPRGAPGSHLLLQTKLTGCDVKCALGSHLTNMSSKVKEGTAQIKTHSFPPKPTTGSDGCWVPTPRPPSSSSSGSTCAYTACQWDNAGPGGGSFTFPLQGLAHLLPPRLYRPAARRAPQPHPYHHGLSKFLDEACSWEARATPGTLRLFVGPNGHVQTPSCPLQLSGLGSPQGRGKGEGGRPWGHRLCVEFWNMA